MANSNSVVTIDRQHFARRSSHQKFSDKKIGQKKPLIKKKLYTHTSKQALTPNQVNQLIKAAMHSPRNGLRDATLILLAYQHGFKVSELINLKWEHIDFENHSILVSRFSDGQKTLHPLDQREIDLLQQLESDKSELVFHSQGKNQMSSQNIHKIIKLAGEEAGFKKPVYPSMLSGAAGFNLISNASNTMTRH